MPQILCEAEAVWISIYETYINKQKSQAAVRTTECVCMVCTRGAEGLLSALGASDGLQSFCTLFSEAGNIKKLCGIYSFQGLSLASLAGLNIA